MTESIEPLKLDYGAPPRASRRIRWIATLLLLVGAIFAGWRWGPYLWHQGNILYWQSKCMRYSPPESMVVYEENPTAAAELLNSSPQYFAYAIYRGKDWNHPGPTVQAAAYRPQGWDKLQAVAGLPLINGIGTVNGAIVFLHELVSPGGNHRLVVIEYDAQRDCFTPLLINRAEVIVPGTWRSGPTRVEKPTVWDVEVMFPTTPPQVRIYAGQVDPADASHFTIRYEMWGQTDVLDGRLDNNDGITLRQRSQPPWR